MSRMFDGLWENKKSFSKQTHGFQVLFDWEKINENMFLKYFSFIFKDDQPVESVEDPEVVNNPLEPIRIEEKVRY